MSRTKNAIKIILGSATLQITIVICGLILPRFILEYYGSEVNGLVSSLKQFLTYFTVVSSGISVASYSALYKPILEKDYDKINGILSATAIFFKKSAYIFSIFMMLLAVLYPLLVKSSIPKMQVIILIFILSSGTLIDYIILSKYRVIANADQKAFVESNIQAQGIVLNTVISIILIKLGFSIISVQLVATIVYLIRAFRLIKYVKKNYPFLNYKKDPDMESIKDRWSAFYYQIAGMIIGNTPIIILTLLCGLNDVSIYSVYNMVFVSLNMIVGIFSSGLAAPFGNIIASGDKYGLNNSYNTYEFLFLFFSFLCYSCALILINPFISIYTNNITTINYLIPFLGVMFVINGISRVIRIPAVTLVEASGKFKDNTNLNIIEAIINVILSVIFTIKFGIIGVLVGASIAALLRSVLYIFYVDKNILRRKSYKLFTVISINFVTMFLLYKIGFNKNINNFFEFFILAFKVGIVSFIVLLTINSIMNIKAAKDLFLRSIAIINEKIINLRRKV
ncbi:polysaccharide biosynthesis C-terminal domain-containing protein [Clostridium perfringens]|uniref:polysaccharide biosynthesis C-terminal domain-containing protein n=1 Tax=Clostridium perfringens TaxID=1502 RepID=UPI002AC3CED1|nr:polysaccharide biosynthesis C-terminal domain-containing protein [Clostridium perfringens]MDZ4996986.1 hypothetical protein [Clostridium perfringens]